MPSCAAPTPRSEIVRFSAVTVEAAAGLGLAAESTGDGEAAIDGLEFGDGAVETLLLPLQAVSKTAVLSSSEPNLSELNLSEPDLSEEEKKAIRMRNGRTV